MIKRIRDKMPNFRPPEKITMDVWEDIRKRYVIAKKFMEEDNPIFIAMKESLKYAEDMILENRVREVREVHRVSDALQKIFITEKKIQDDELVGQIKFIRNTLAEIQSWITRKEELELREMKGEVLIEHDEEKRG